MRFRFQPGLRAPVHTSVVVEMSVGEFLELQETLNNPRIKKAIREQLGSENRSILLKLLRGCNRLYNHFSVSVSPQAIDFDPDAPERQRGMSPCAEILDEIWHETEEFQQEILENMTAGMNRRLAKDRLNAELDKLEENGS